MQQMSRFVKALPYSLILLPFIADAAIVPCVPKYNAATQKIEGLCTFKDLFKMLVDIYNFLLGLAAIVFMGMIVYAGIRMLTFYISETPDADLKNAKYTLTRAITGFVIIVGAYLIVRTVVSFFGVGVDQYFGGGFLNAK